MSSMSFSKQKLELEENLEKSMKRLFLELKVGPIRLFEELKY